jgi:membrane protein implicated in regulation of membrane protease activity
VQTIVDLTDYLWIVWLVFILLFVIIELLSFEFTFLMIAVGSLGGLGANLLGWPWWLQILIAAAISVLLLLIIRPLLLKTLRKGADLTPSNVPALIGLRARVMGAFVEGRGLVKLANGETWTARIDDEIAAAELTEGATVVVLAIEGSTAVVDIIGRESPA